MARVGVSVSVAELTIFPAISLINVVLVVVLLKNVR
jgi:hypothetical protein